jgi:hypothetical protein
MVPRSAVDQATEDAYARWVPNRVRPRAIVEEVYGFAFPDDLYALSDFARTHPDALAALDLTLDGPFALTAGEKTGVGKGWDPGGDRPRFYDDPPEFFTIAIGDGDGRHWGYWFDDPAGLPPVVASFNRASALPFTAHGDSVFHAVRSQLERLAREAHESSSADKAAELDDLARAREKLAGYALGDRSEVGATYLERYAASRDVSRKPIAKTRTGLGIVVPKNAYRAPDGDDTFQATAFKPSAGDVAQAVADAKQAVADGFAGNALKLGHDLWTYRDLAEPAHDLLDRAYSALGRKLLRDYLKRISSFRKRSESVR